MNKIEKILSAFGYNVKLSEAVEIKQASLITDAEGKLIIEGEYAIGDAIVDVDGNVVADGEYVLANGDTLIVLDGKINEVKSVEVETPETEVEVSVEQAEEAPVEVAQAIDPEVLSALDALAQAIVSLTARIESLEAMANEAPAEVAQAEVEVKQSEVEVKPVSAKEALKVVQSKQSLTIGSTEWKKMTIKERIQAL